MLVGGNAHQACIWTVVVTTAFCVNRQHTGNLRDILTGIMTGAAVSLVFARAVAKDPGIRMLSLNRHRGLFIDDFHG